MKNANPTVIAIALIASLTLCFITFLNFHTFKWPVDQAKYQAWTEQAENAPKNFKLVCQHFSEGEIVTPDMCQRQDHYTYDRNYELGGISAGQKKAYPGQKSDVASPVAEHQRPAQEEPEPVQEQTSIANEDIVGDQDSPLVERVSKLAEKANWAFLISFLATIFAGLAWLAAKKGADIGQDALDETIIANERAQRAWISVAGVPHSVVETFRANLPDGNVAITQNAMTVSIKVKNVGQTPAKELRTRMDFRIVPNGASVPIFDTTIEKVERATFVPQGGYHSGNRLDIIGEDSRRVWDKTHKVYLFLSCEYKTIFNETIRCTRETFEFYPEGTHTVNGVEIAKFRISQVGTQNCNT